MNVLEIAALIGLCALSLFSFLKTHQLTFVVSVIAIVVLVGNSDLEKGWKTFTLITVVVVFAIDIIKGYTWRRR